MYGINYISYVHTNPTFYTVASYLKRHDFKLITKCTTFSLHSRNYIRVGDAANPDYYGSFLGCLQIIFIKPLPFSELPLCAVIIQLAHPLMFSLWSLNGKF